MELLRITRQIHCKAVEQRATLMHRQYNRDWGTSYSRPPIDPYLTSPLLPNPGGACLPACPCSANSRTYTTNRLIIRCEKFHRRSLLSACHLIGVAQHSRRVSNDELLLTDVGNRKSRVNVLMKTSERVCVVTLSSEVVEFRLYCSSWITD